MDARSITYTKKAGYWNVDVPGHYIGRFTHVLEWFSELSRRNSTEDGSSNLFVAPYDFKEQEHYNNAIVIGFDLLHMNRSLDTPPVRVYCDKDNNTELMFLTYSTSASIWQLPNLSPENQQRVKKAWCRYIPADVYGKDEMRCWLVTSASGNLLHMISSTFDSAFTNAVADGGPDPFWDETTNAFGDITPYMTCTHRK